MYTENIAYAQAGFLLANYIEAVLNLINRQNIYICMCFINVQSCTSKLSIISYVCVTSRLKSVFTTTNVHLYLDARGNSHYEMKCARSQQSCLHRGGTVASTAGATDVPP